MAADGKTEAGGIPVLIVDDDQESVNGLSRLLRDTSYAVRTAQGGHHAMEMLRQAPAQVVVTDLRMPLMDGIHLTKSILREFPDTRIVLLTGAGDMAAAVEAMRAGAVDYLEKPVAEERLKNSLEQAVVKYRDLAARPAKGGDSFMADTRLDLGPVELEYREISGYRLIRMLGHGSYGSVYLCRRNSDGKLYAMKIPHRGARPCEGAAGGSVQRFANEAIAISNLDHPNIIRFVEYGETMIDEALTQFYVMEYFASEPLRKLMDSSRPLTTRAKIHIIKQAALALHAVHSIGVFHRDVKPENLLIDKDLTVKVADFGVCHLPNSELTMSSTMLGTPSYLAPEYMQTGRCDIRADIYALGVVAYELFSWRRPYQASTLGELVMKIGSEAPMPLGEAAPGVLPIIESVVMKMIERDPDDRQQTAAAVAEQFARAESECGDDA